MANWGQSMEQRLNPSVAAHQAAITQVMQILKVCRVGQVQAFRPGPPPVVDVMLSTDELLLVNKSETGGIDLETHQRPLPLLQGVPVFTLGGGGFTVTFPINAGDECVVVFSDDPLDIWLQNGDTRNAPISQRRHSLSDGIAFVGIRATPRGLSPYSTNGMELRSDDGNTRIGLGKDGTITINTSGTVNINGGRINIGSDTHIDGFSFLGHKHLVTTAPGTTSGVAVASSPPLTE